ncbi:MAG: sigma-70 family RNA polymerase sigma factor [Paludibaculum sp.]
MPDVTQLLREWREGRKEAAEELAPLVYQELRRLAGVYMSRERPDHTLQPTALVHEAYLKLVRETVPDYENRAHFTAVAAHHMRQVLVDHARRHRAGKRGGGVQAVALEDTTLFQPERSRDLLALDEALSEMTTVDPRKARVVEMYFFGGMNREEIAAVLGVHFNTVSRDLRMAQAWLKTRILR